MERYRVEIRLALPWSRELQNCTLAVYDRHVELEYNGSVLSVNSTFREQTLSKGGVSVRLRLADPAVRRAWREHNLYRRSAHRSCYHQRRRLNARTLRTRGPEPKVYQRALDPSYAWLTVTDGLSGARATLMLLQSEAPNGFDCVCTDSNGLLFIRETVSPSECPTPDRQSLAAGAGLEA